MNLDIRIIRTPYGVTSTVDEDIARVRANVEVKHRATVSAALDDLAGEPLGSVTGHHRDNPQPLHASVSYEWWTVIVFDARPGAGIVVLK